jgi:acid phosphatase
LIIPNMCHDMHDCGVAAGDAWLRTFVPRITGSAAWHDGGTLFVTFDEGVASTTPPNRIATIVSSPLVPAGTTSDVPHDHYSLLRTVQNAFGLDCLEDSCSANTLGEFFSKSP